MGELSKRLPNRGELASQTPHVAIFGGESGLVGKALRKKLEGRGVVVTPLGRQTNVVLGGREIHGVDLTDTRNIGNVLRSLKESGVTALVNSSAETDVNKVENQRGDESGSAYQLNAVAPGILARACKAVGIPFLHISTEGVYPDHPDEAEGRYRESDIPDPDQNLTWYGYTKAKGEQAVLAAYPEGAAIARLGSVQGENKGIYRVTLNQLHAGEPFTRVNDQLIAPLPDFVIADFLDAMIERMHDPVSPLRGVYNLCATDAHTPLEIAHMLANEPSTIRGISQDERVATTPGVVKQPNYAILDSSKIQLALGLTLPTVQQGIEMYKAQYPTR